MDFILFESTWEFGIFVNTFFVKQMTKFSTLNSKLSTWSKENTHITTHIQNHLDQYTYTESHIHKHTHTQTHTQTHTYTNTHPLIINLEYFLNHEVLICWSWTKISLFYLFNLLCLRFCVFCLLVLFCFKFLRILFTRFVLFKLLRILFWFFYGIRRKLQKTKLSFSIPSF